MVREPPNLWIDGVLEIVHRTALKYLLVVRPFRTAIHCGRPPVAPGMRNVLSNHLLCRGGGLAQPGHSSGCYERPVSRSSDM